MPIQFGNKMYDFLKKVAQIYLPAAGTLYAGLAVIWGLPAVEQVGGTVLAVDTFLGIILGLSSSTYKSSGARYDGQILLSTNPDGKKIYSLQLNDDVMNLDTKEEVVFQMVPR